MQERSCTLRTRHHLLVYCCALVASVACGLTLGCAGSLAGPTFLTDVFFVDANSGWTVGVNGFIARSSDGGVTWTPVRSGTTKTLHSVFFIDTKQGWAAGEEGTILITSDGGSTWTAGNTGTKTHIECIRFVDGTRGWAVGVDGAVGSRVLKSDNGGIDWRTQFRLVGPLAMLTGVSMIDNNLGWITGRSTHVYRTSNGGGLWSKQDAVEYADSQSMNSIFFVDARNGVAVGINGTIVATHDGGEHWSRGAGAFGELTDVHLVTPKVGWAVGRFGTVLKTNDGGGTWSKQETKTESNLWSVHFIDVNRGWVVQDGGVILRTGDGGKSWKGTTVTPK